MLSIIAHHFVVNSGLYGVDDSPIITTPNNVNSLYLLLFGMWGKTGINCFVMITGYFMCKSQISLKKLFKFFMWIYTYRFLFYTIFFALGYEVFSIPRLIQVIMPVWGFNSNFTSCFLGFWLTIPFWNILINNINRKQHICITVLLLFFYTVLGSIPGFYVTFNYVTWFGIIYLIASYIRLYPNKIFDNKKVWIIASAFSIFTAMASVLVMHRIFNKYDYFFVSDSNKIFAVAVAVSTFLLFKNINISYSKIINIIGGTTFGVLLIHANSEAMRQWLWKDVVDCVGHYSLPLPKLILFSIASVLIIFFVCSAIDFLRQLLIEGPFFRWYDKKNISQCISNWFCTFPLIKKLTER
jgi:hypothetical protein